MDNPGYSENIDHTVPRPAGFVPPNQSRIENVERGIGGSTSHTDHVPVRQELPSTAGLNNPANGAYMNYGAPPPPYSPVDLGNVTNKPNTHNQEDDIPQHITIVTLEEPPGPCSNKCSWSCCRRVHMALALILVILAIVKVATLFF